MAQPNMSLGGITFDDNPSTMTVIKEDKVAALQETYGGAEFFSWGTFLIGKQIDLEWTFMPISEFDDLQDLVETDATVVFNPQIGDDKTYNVEILAPGISGEYHITQENLTTAVRKNVKMSLSIVSEV